jgi:hypothetical protein
VTESDLTLDEIVERVEQLRDEWQSGDSPDKLLTAKIGHLAEAELAIEAMTEDDFEGAIIDYDDAADYQRRDAVAGILTPLVGYAVEHDIDITKAVEERLEAMEDIDTEDDVQPSVSELDASDDNDVGRGFQ